MPSTFLMSYPGPNWQIRGAANFRSEARTATNPKKAFAEWIGLCDSITRAGGRILVMPPAAPLDPVAPPLTGMVYTANAGQVIHTSEGWTWLQSRMAVAHRQPEAAHIRAFVERAGMAVRESAHVWEGQADLQFVKSNLFIATWGVRSEKASVDEVRGLLPSGSKVLDLQLRQPFFHGDTCLNAITNRGGDTFLLAHIGAFVGADVNTLRSFFGDRVEVVAVEEEDALNYACNALCVQGTVMLPVGMSTSLRSHLVRRGFTYEEMDLPELFGKGGGGPRCLVNELRGLVVNAGAPDYASLRDDLVAKLATYPESVAPPAPAAPPPPAAPAV